MILSRFGWFMAVLLLLAVVALAWTVRIVPRGSEDSGAREAEATSPAKAPVDSGDDSPAISEPSVEMPAVKPRRRALPNAKGVFTIPVAGVGPDDLIDSYGDPRGNGRTHEGIDIIAASGTPVLAAADGTIEKLYFSNGGGGITLYERSANGRWMFYYAHLAGYAPGIREGMAVKAGQRIAFIGDSGNAPDGVYHLHFGVSRMAKDDGWWQGTPVDPYPLLARSARER